MSLPEGGISVSFGRIRYIPEELFAGRALLLVDAGETAIVRAKKTTRTREESGSQVSRWKGGRLIFLLFRLSLRASFRSATFRPTAAEALMHPLEPRLDLSFVEL